MGAAGGDTDIPSAPDDAAPFPMPFTARNLILYGTPFTNVVPLDDTVVITIESVVSGELLRFTHVVPLSVEYWYVVIAEPLLGPALKDMVIC